MKKLTAIILLIFTSAFLLSCESETGSSNANEGICWYADRSLGWVAKVSAEGDRVLLRFLDVVEPVAVAAVPFDGSVWICDVGAHELVHIDLEGQILKRVSGFAQPIALAVDPLEEDVWIVDAGTKMLTKLGPRGTIWKTYSGFANPKAVALDNTNSDDWVADGDNGLWKFDVDANPIAHFVGLGFVGDVSTDVDDGRVYIADPKANRITCLSPAGDLQWVFTGETDMPLQTPTQVRAAPGDTVWVLEVGAHRIRRVGTAGLVTLASREWDDSGNNPIAITVDWKKDEVWVGDIERHRVIVSNKGAEAKSWVGGLGEPVSLSIYNSGLDRE